MSSPSPTAPSATISRPIRSALGTAVVVIAATAWITYDTRSSSGELRKTVKHLSAELASVQSVLELLRLERGSQGLGATAIIEQIQHWAPLLQSAKTPATEASGIKGKLHAAIAAVTVLGTEAAPRFEQALTASHDDEVRKWLLRACVAANPESGKQLTVALVRGTRHSPSARMRFIAADELLAQDKALCGEVLHDILLLESHQGITRPVPPGLENDYSAMIKGQQFPAFYNFISRFVVTEHADIEAVLLMILGRAEHDLMTYKECIRLLGARGSMRAVPRIEELYEHPPGIQLDPFLQIKCLDALAQIRGKDACEFFHKAARTASMEIVRKKLQHLIKLHCQ